MQICYRCEEKTNRFLEKIAKKNSISKNYLIDEIIKDYLNQNQYHLSGLHHDDMKKEILSGIQSANEQLAHIAEELNNLQIYMENEDNPLALEESIRAFRRYTIQALLETAKTLEVIRKNFHLSKT